VKVDGRECLLRAVDLFTSRDDVSGIVVGFSPARDAMLREKFSSHLMFAGVKAATGGPALGAQIAACVAKLPAEATHVIVHDAARPAVPQGDIDRLCESAEVADVVAPASPVHGPLARADDAGNVLGVEPPGGLRHVHWPIVFRRDALDAFARSGFDAIAGRLALVPGSPLNVRVDSDRDASLAKQMLAIIPKPRSKGPTNPFEEASW
jgi:2-C-methyl-D-erythritol 4-phosphate cytidylyltransferase